MPSGNLLLFVVGSALAMALLAIGAGVGFRWGRRRSESRRGAPGDGLGEAERERVVQMLHQLGSWTSEYSGNVTQYQTQLGEVSAVVRSLSGSSADARVVTLLEQIMRSNEQLKNRLDAAEHQLDEQTRQIESYLCEARTDALTGLHNRRAFDQKLDQMFAGYRQGGRSFVVALLDIDRFKSINDTHGHPVGDEVLQQVASLLNHHARSEIIVARYGGEEFSLLLDGPLRVAAERMNELRKAIASQRFAAENLHLDVTVSIGLSEPRNESVPAPLVRRADEALYAAKNIGRNRVYYHDGRSPILVGAPEVMR